jgi:zinc protease
MTRARFARFARFALVVAAACGPKAQPSTTPTLPGDDPSLLGATPDAGPAEAAPERDPWVGRTDLIAAPPPAPARPVPLAKPTRFTLANGLSVVVVPDRSLPIASFELAVRAGSIDEPRDKRGLADVVATLLLRGTRNHTAEELATAADRGGAALGASADFEATHVTCTALSADSRTCLSLLADVAAAPSFPDLETREILDAISEELLRVHDSPPRHAGEHLENLVWGEDHVRGWPATIEALRKLSRADCIAWHKKHFVASNAVLVAVGDLDPAALRKDLDKTLGRWARGKKPARKAWPEPKLDGLKLRLVDRPDMSRSVILVGALGLAHGSPDLHPMIVVNHALGAAGESRLGRALAAIDPAYRASSTFERWAGRGTFEVSTSVGHADAVQALTAIRAELARMREQGPTADELARAKRSLAGAYPLGFQRAADVTAAVVSAELHQLGDDYVRDFAVRLSEVTLEDVQRAARAHVPADDLAVVIYGRAADVAPLLAEAKLPFEKIDHDDPIARKEREALAAKRNAPPDPAKAAAGKKLLDQALAAKGGADALRAIQDLKLVGAVRVTAAAQSLDGELRRYLVTPDKMRLDMTVYDVTITMVIDGRKVWQRIGDKKALNLPPHLIDDALEGLWRDRDLILLRHLDEGTVVQSVGKETVNGNKYDAVAIRRADGSANTRILLDPKTHLIFRLIYEEAGEVAFEEYSDYRDVNGVKFAFQQRARGSEQSFEVKVDTLLVNGGVDKTLFDKP